MLKFNALKLHTFAVKSQLRHFSKSLSNYIDLSSHNSIKDTINFIDSSSKIESVNDFNDIINHHATILDSKSNKTEEEYTDLYNLSLKLSKLLESTPDVNEEVKKEILNNLIERFTKYNYAISTLAFKKLLNDKTSLSQNSINQLITHNPGRVESSWNLYNSLKPENQSHDEILVSTMKKLLFGDPVEVKENLHAVDLQKLIKIMKLYETIGNKDLIDESLSIELVKSLIKLECTAVITQMVIPSSIFEKIISDSSIELNNSDYLYFYEASINNGVSLSGNSLLKSFMPISKLQLTSHVESENLKTLKSTLNIETIELAPLPDVVDEIREQILELGLDDNPRIMLDLIKSAGFHSNDLQTAINYFQNYQFKIPDGTPEQNDLKSTLSLVCVYDCIYKEDGKMIDVAEALVPQSPLPASNNLSSLILYHGWFGNTDKSFDIYNQALNLFLKPHEGNESNRGMLIQSLIIVSLLGKEVELSRLIKQKSLEHNSLDEVYEIKITNIFKEYGDIVEEVKDDEGEFRKSFKKIILRTIMEMSP